jgi:hypothetical protein
MLMDLNFKVILKMTSLMGMEESKSMMGLGTLGSSVLGCSMGKESFTGQMAVSTMDNGKTMK